MKFLAVLFLISTPVGLRALDREAFTPTRYDLNVQIEPQQERLGVRGTITVRNDSSGPQRDVTLQISSSLNWSSITLAGKSVEWLTQSYISDMDHTGALSEAIVVLPQPVAPNETVELEIGYEGVIQQDITRLARIGVPEADARRSDWDQISPAFTAVRGMGYVAWYPIATEAVSLSAGEELADRVARWREREARSEMKVRFTGIVAADRPSKLVCNGARAPLSYEETGRTSEVVTECSFLPGRDAPVFALGHFEILDRPLSTILHLPEHGSQAQDYASALDEVRPLVEKWFGDHREGTEAKAEVVDLPDPQAAAYESENMLFLPLAGGDTRLLLSAARQVTRMFFPSPRPWIQEGLAGYAQLRLIEAKEGRTAALAYLESHRGALVRSQKTGDRVEAVESGPLIHQAGGLLLSAKAMYVWQMLSQMIGDGALAAALANYKAAEDRSPNYMQKVIEAEAHRDLQWFFEDWVYQDRGLPDFRIASVYPGALASGGYMVTVTLENLGEAGAEVPVTLRLEAGEASARLVVPGKSTSSIRIQTASPPVSAEVNDGSVPESDMTNNQYKVEPLHH